MTNKDILTKSATLAGSAALSFHFLREFDLKDWAFFVFALGIFGAAFLKSRQIADKRKQFAALYKGES